MAQMILTPEQLNKLRDVEDPILRRRFALYYQLPQDLQDSMFAGETSDSVWSVTKEKYNLSDENVSAVARIIGLVFLGELPIQNFISELASVLNIGKEKAGAIAHDINQIIFQPVRESLIKVHGIEESEIKKPILPATEPSFEPKIEQPSSFAPAEAETLTDKIVKENGRAPQPPVADEIETQQEAERARQELIDRLRQARQEKEVSPLEESEPRASKQENEKTDGPIAPAQHKEPFAAQTAWNGRTIDLRKIPPRRKAKKRNDGFIES